MAMPIEKIEEMTMEEVIKRYNEVAGHTVESLNSWTAIYYNKKNEMVLKEQQHINKQMLLYTKAMTLMTVIVVVATIVNLIITIVN